MDLIFYNRHKKLLSAFLVAAFVLPIIFLYAGFVAAMTQTPVVPPSEADSDAPEYSIPSSYDGNQYHYDDPIAQSIYEAEQLGIINYLEFTAATYLVYYQNNPQALAALRAEIIRQRQNPYFVPENADAPAVIPYDRDTLTNIQQVGPGVASAVTQTKNVLERIIGSMAAWFFYYMAVGLAWIMMLITKLMLIVGTFNSFLSQPVVRVGWTITRDICNNFFIVFMMILAAAVTLHIPNYAWRTMLPKILIFAVVINFSMTITGVLIDISQVLMLTFASPLATTDGYHIILSAFGLPSALNLQNVLEGWKGGEKDTLDPTKSGIRYIDIIAALLFAVIVTLVAIVVVTCITAILVYRIIMLMFLVILSPLFFLSKAFNLSVLNQFTGEWMGNLSSMLTVGPAMMFFLYLSLMTMAAVNNTNVAAGQSPQSVLQGGKAYAAQLNKSENLVTTGAAQTSPMAPATGNNSSNATYTAISGMASVKGLINFLIVCGLLWASLMMGKRFGGAAASVASKGMGQIMSGAKKFSGFNLAKQGAAKLQKAPGALVDMGLAKAGTGALGLASAATRDLSKRFKSEGLQKLADVGSTWRAEVLQARRDSRANKFKAFQKSLGFSDKPGGAIDKFKQFTDTDFAKTGKKIVLGTGAAVAGGAAMIATGGVAAVPMLAGAPGLGAISSLAGAAGVYFGGGGRWAQMFLGQKGKKQDEDMAAENQKIADTKRSTDNLVADSAQARDAEAKKKLAEKQSKLSDAERLRDNTTSTAESKRDAELARAKARFETLPAGLRKEYQNIKDATIQDVGSLGTEQSLPLLEALADEGWSSGQPITDDMLARAKEAALNSDEYGLIRGYESDLRIRTDKVNDDYDKEAEYADNKYASDVSRVESDYGPEDKIKNDAEKAHHDRVIATLRGSGNEAEAKRFETEYDAQVELDLQTGKIKAALDKKLEEIEQSGDSEMDKIEARRAAELERDAKLSNANEAFSEKIAAAQPQGPQAKASARFLNAFKPYAHENWVSQASGREAGKMQEEIKELVKVLEDATNEFEEIKRGSFYSSNGQTEQQYKSIKSLIDSTEATRNLINALSRMGPQLFGAKAQMVKELKQGIAAFSKGGGDITKLAGLISQLNSKTGKTEDGKKVIDDKTVAEYLTKIKAKI